MMMNDDDNVCIKTELMRSLFLPLSVSYYCFGVIVIILLAMLIIEEKEGKNTRKAIQIR